jgi:hypothetical protein
MKIAKAIILSLFLVFGMCHISGVAFSQDKKMSHQEKKDAEKARREANYMILDSLLNSRQFVLEADYLQNFRGERISVVSNLNFIKLTGTRGILQTGSNSGMGSNGVGGVTAEGDIGYWKLTKNPKNHSYYVHFNLMTSLGPFDVSLSVNADNNANATISGITAGNLTWSGHLNTLNNSSVFKGTNAFY